MSDLSGGQCNCGERLLLTGITFACRGVEVLLSDVKVCRKVMNGYRKGHGKSSTVNNETPPPPGGSSTDYESGLKVTARLRFMLNSVTPQAARSRG